MVAGGHGHRRAGHRRRRGGRDCPGDPPADAGRRPAPRLGAWPRNGGSGGWALPPRLLCLAALLAGLFGTGLVAGFILLGALLIAAALLLPLLLHGLLVSAQSLRARRTGAVVLGRHPPAASRPVAGPDGAAAGAGGQHRRRHHGRQLSADLHRLARPAPRLRALRHRRDRRRRLPPCAPGWKPRADAVLPIWNVEARVAGLPAEIYGVADHPTYRDNWPLLQAAPDVWDRVADGSGVLVNEQLARREALWHRRRPSLCPAAGPPEIVGVYSDYGNPSGQVFIGARRTGTALSRCRETPLRHPRRRPTRPPPWPAP